MSGDWNMERLDAKMLDDTDWTVDELSSLFESRFWDKTMRKTKPLTRKEIDRMMDKWFNDLKKWRKYRGVVAYFIPLDYVKNRDARLIASFLSDRLALEIEIYDGRVSHALNDDVTHVVCVLRDDIPLSISALCRSLGLREEENILVKDGATFAVSHKWVEDSLSLEDHLPKDDFLLKKEDCDESSRVPMLIPPPGSYQNHCSWFWCSSIWIRRIGRVKAYTA